MLRESFFKLIGKWAQKTFVFALNGGCWFYFYQEEIPKEAYLESKKEN